MTALVLVLILLPGWAYLAGIVVATARFAQRRVVAAAEQPPVSVLTPLCGAEAGLEENLRSFADQDYPSVQIVFGARSPTDGALPVARKLIAERPQSDIDRSSSPRGSPAAI